MHLIYETFKMVIITMTSRVSLGACELPQKNWARLVSPAFLRYNQTNNDE